MNRGTSSSVELELQEATRRQAAGPSKAMFCMTLLTRGTGQPCEMSQSAVGPATRLQAMPASGGIKDVCAASLRPSSWSTEVK